MLGASANLFARIQCDEDTECNALDWFVDVCTACGLCSMKFVPQEVPVLLRVEFANVLLSAPTGGDTTGAVSWRFFANDWRN